MFKMNNMVQAFCTLVVTYVNMLIIDSTGMGLIAYTVK